MNHFTAYTTILFDLDGTLSDSKLGIIRCLQYSLEKFGIVETDIEKLTHCIGPSLSYTYKEWYGLSDEEARQAVTFYRQRFETEGIFENTLYEGVPALLESLKKSGKTLLVATAKPTVHAKRILMHENIADYFTEIVGSNLDGTRENKGEVIAYALDCLENPDKASILMIGDRMHDIIGARDNGLPAIAVGYGYGTSAELTAAKPAGFVNSVEQLKQVLLGS